MGPRWRCPQCGDELAARGRFAARNRERHLRRHARERREAQAAADAAFRERIRRERSPEGDR
jgi:hypothetical protein